MKRKNSGENYLDKETHWKKIDEIPIDLILETVLNELNNIPNRRWFRRLENLRRDDLNILSKFYNEDGSYTIYENIKNIKILSSIDIAIKLEHFESEYTIIIYSKLPRNKTWKQEAVINSLGGDYSLYNLRFQIQEFLIEFLMQIFPKFYNSQYFRRFEELQQLGREEYETYLRTRKKNPKKFKRGLSK